RLAGSDFLDGIGVGGALANGAPAEFLPAALTVHNSTFTGNEAAGGAGDVGVPGGQAGGAALTNGFGSVAQVRHCTISDNLSHAGKGGDGADGNNALGGAILNTFAGATLTVSNSTLTGNRAVGGDGGVGGNGGTAEGGALIALYESTTTITGSTFTDN